MRQLEYKIEGMIDNKEFKDFDSIITLSNHENVLKRIAYEISGYLKSPIYENDFLDFYTNEKEYAYIIYKRNFRILLRVYKYYGDVK